MNNVVVIPLIVLLTFILITVIRLLSSSKRQPQDAASKKPVPAGASVKDAEGDAAAADDGIPAPRVVDYDGEFRMVDADGVLEITTEDEYEPWNDVDDDMEQEPLIPQQDAITRDFWASWDRAASSENSEDKIREYSRILADNGYITPEQAEEVAAKSIAYSRQAIKDATRLHSGIFSEEYSFPAEPERVYIEY